MQDDKNCGLTRQDHLDLEGYRTLQDNLNQDAMLGMLFERLMLPLIVAAPIVAFRYLEDGRSLVLGAGIMSMILLMLKAIRNEKRVMIRFEIMHDIERKLKFRSHLEVYNRLKKFRYPRDFHLRLIFFSLAIIIYFLLLIGKIDLTFLEPTENLQKND